MDVVAHRRALHAIPELDRQLPETTGYVRQVLEGLSCKVFSPTEGSVCAYFDQGRETTLALRADMDALFGPGSELTVKKMLGQPGQYASEETVTIRGPKGELSRVRVLGPLRAQTQVEISIADGFTLGVKPPVRESGQLKDTPGIEIIGPCGSVKKDSGVIAALRHVHMTPKDAARFGVEDGQYIQTEIDGLRGAILCNVLVRVSDKYALEMHIDVEEANALGVKNGDRAFFLDD